MLEDPRNEELSWFVGNKGSSYLEIWNKKTKKTVGPLLLSWNWSAFVAGILWFGYRKMYIYIFFFALVEGMSFVGLTWFQFLCLVGYFHICMGITANGLYYMMAKVKIGKIKEKYGDINQQQEAIIEAGGTSWKGILWTGLAITVFVILPKIVSINIR